jgi:hypothetical protein
MRHVSGGQPNAPAKSADVGSAQFARGCLISTAALCALLLPAAGAAAADAAILRGSVHFQPTAAESQVGERFRLAEHTFPWQATRAAATQHVEVWDVTFPSPIVTPQEGNNTVHGEYYRPLVEGERPGVIVLHILGGDFALSRLFCNALAQHGVAAFFVKMPYYGPRRDPTSPRRMVSGDPRETVEGMTQAVLDIRRATAWLAARPEVDDDELGIFGISLGGITGGLAAAAEPRLKNVCLLLAGGGVGQIAWDSLELRTIREKWLAEGKSREEFIELLRQVDPVNAASKARPLGAKSFCLTNSAASRAPNSRSMPLSSHSTERGPGSRSG